MTLQWIKKESWDCIGINNVSLKIQEFGQQYKTQIVVSKLNPQKTLPNEHFRVEVWYNLDSSCYIINAFSLDYM